MVPAFLEETTEIDETKTDKIDDIDDKYHVGISTSCADASSYCAIEICRKSKEKSFFY